MLLVGYLLQELVEEEEERRNRSHGSFDGPSLTPNETTKSQDARSLSSRLPLVRELDDSPPHHLLLILPIHIIRNQLGHPQRSDPPLLFLPRPSQRQSIIRSFLFLLRWTVIVVVQKSTLTPPSSVPTGWDPPRRRRGRSSSSRNGRCRRRRLRSRLSLSLMLVEQVEVSIHSFAV
ncbi:hypothetical protein BDY24DRAFT_76198 [Mrakia frigida]|uniref:uncharacterized protein n=1 Tax=Mrakia frigida TaxID=29902 RepID=UPI003FCC0CE7